MTPLEMLRHDVRGSIKHWMLTHGQAVTTDELTNATLDLLCLDTLPVLKTVIKLLDSIDGDDALRVCHARNELARVFDAISIEIDNA